MQRFIVQASLLLWLSCSYFCAAQTELSVDASRSVAPARAAAYNGGASRAPDGRVIGVTDRYLTLAGKPWIPVMGEMHYARVPEAEWDADLASMKAAGVDVVSTYVIWIYHEEVQDQWDWSGRRDLRRFAQLCQKHGLLLMVRIGPWAHAETRNGGLPDWVMHGGPVRQMDPKFMAETHTFDDQIGMQLRGLLWKDGGPVIGVQIENEYALRGPGKGAPYILALKAMARQAGLDVPLYTITGWDNAVVPPGEFLPVYGGYSAAPWGGTTAPLAPPEVYAFRFRNRVSGNMGMIGGKISAEGKEELTSPAATPFLTAEMGGGIEDTYHRRPVLGAEDVAAMAPVMLGSGVNGYGVYMMVGGEDPEGKLTTLEESQATGYPTDVPVKSYDFQAPISEFGSERPSLRLLKEWNYFMQDFGAELAPMPAFAPSLLPHDPTDLSPLRWSVRTDGQAGFVFVNNYVRGAAMPAKAGIQFSVSLPGGRTATIPQQPIDLPSGVFFAWPFGVQLGNGMTLQYATAQMMAKLPASAKAGETDVLFCIRGTRCELLLGGDGLRVHASAGIHITRSVHGVLLTRDSDAAAQLVITATAKEATVAKTRAQTASATVRLLLLSPETAVNTWKLPVAGEERLVRTGADIRSDNEQLVLLQIADPAFHFSIYPALGAPLQADVPVLTDGQGFQATLAAAHFSVALQKQRAAGKMGPVRLGPALPWRPVGVAEAPADAVWAQDAARWTLRLEPMRMTGDVSNVFLRFRYVGDEARLLSADGRVLEDNFWNGEPWMVGLRRFAASDGRLPGLQLQLLPIRADAPIYLSPTARAALPESGQAIYLQNVEGVPAYQLRLQDAAAKGRPQ